MTTKQGSGLKAIILVGGYGTRLRPLTLTRPKPLVPFCNKPILLFQLEALARVGVKHVILAISYMPEEFKSHVAPFLSELDMKISYSHEREPLGTAGALALAANLLDENDNEPFFMLNSDIVTRCEFSKILEFHRKHKHEGTIVIVPVSDPSKYGVVICDENDGLIRKFVEKPQEYIGNYINAGIYVFNKSILSRIPLKKSSIEREIFPVMSEQGQLHAIATKDFWFEVGQLKDYICGMEKYLSVLQNENSSLLTTGSNVIPPVIIDPTVVIGVNCSIGPNVTIDANCVLGDGVCIKNSALLEGVKIKGYCWINLSLIGWHSSVGKWTRLDNYTVLGSNVDISDQVFINGAKILPYKSISESIMDPLSVIM